MSFVIISGERYALDFGETVIGGSGAGALDARALRDLPPLVVITFPMEGPSTVRSLRARPVRVNGVELGEEARVLQHGDRLSLDDLVVAFGDIGKAGRTGPNDGAPEASPGGLIQNATTTPTACTGGRVTRLGDRAVFLVPDWGLTLGRDPSSDVVLGSKDVSRSHATIAPGLLGYTITDRSANGILVNGVRVERAHLLGQGDVIRLGHDELRFDADEASFESGATPLDQSLPAPRAPASSAARAPRLLATLEVLSAGPMHGKRFRIDRPTTQLGRGPHSDVRLENESVSASHASLVLRGNRWLVLDLGSRNGTFVDGEMVREQQELPTPCELRLGTLAMDFRVINAGRPQGNSTIRVIGVNDA